MNEVIEYVKLHSEEFTSYIEIIKLLMEQAERESVDGLEKLTIVLHAWDTIKCSPTIATGLRHVPTSTVQTVIETIIFATNTTIAVNKSTGCWTSFIALFKRKKLGIFIQTSMNSHSLLYRS